MDLCIVIWLYCWWAYILLYGYIVNGPIYCYMVILLVDVYMVIWLYCWWAYIWLYGYIVDGPIY